MFEGRCGFNSPLAGYEIRVARGDGEGLALKRSAVGVDEVHVHGAVVIGVSREALRLDARAEHQLHGLGLVKRDVLSGAGLPRLSKRNTQRAVSRREHGIVHLIASFVVVPIGEFVALRRRKSSLEMRPFPLGLVEGTGVGGGEVGVGIEGKQCSVCLLYTSPSPRDS